MHMHFRSHPMVARVAGRGVWAEGVALDPGAALSFKLGVENYGFLVPIGARLTGEEWVHRIRRAYDCTPGGRNAAVVDAIERCMLVEQFRGKPVAPRYVEWPSLDLRDRALAVIASQNGRAGRSAITPEQEQDAEAIAWALYALAVEHGMSFYGVVGSVPGMRMRSGQPAQELSPSSIEESLQIFVGDLHESGRALDPASPIYLMGHPPLINPEAACHVGQFVDKRVFAWAVPHAHALRALERCLERGGQEREPQRMRA